ncbi:hypothetical protein Nepgr_026317 [Nepenthes gracilis]|uniref:Methyltransferase small domain-containing protein n=1 Tax=Nepenthes gracilis TaxID=150966 RepID=A0AAD3T850_NEPGR|nr:hypothetical protein Nepgr_026317 [Nepenthes gracilis]
MKTTCFIRVPSFCTPISPIIRKHLQKSFNKTGHYNQNHISTLNSAQTSISTSPSSPAPSTSHKPQTPVFLRPLIYSSTFPDLQSFTSWAKTLVSSVGSTFVQLDNGSDSTLLLRELRWLLEDSIDDPSLIPHLGICQNGGITSNTGSSSTEVVRLRVSLGQMYQLWKQRIQERRPFQYIVGCEHWRDLVLSVEEGVLIPRPETEKIVDLVGNVVGGNEMLREGLWADLGTGSGALAIGIARILGKNGRVIATDLSPTAISVAKFNVERYGLQDIIEIKQGSWFSPLVHVEGELDGLVCNPPYIPSEDIGSLQAEVAKHEPRLALDGGVEGMDNLLHLCERTAAMLKPGGFFAFETNGEKQCRLLANHMENEMTGSFRDVNIVSDFADIPRFLTGFCD